MGTPRAQGVSRRRFASSGLAAVAGVGLFDRALAQNAPAERTFVPQEVQARNIAVVNEFCAAWARKDFRTLGDSLADDCTFRVTQSRPPIVGKKAVMEAIANFLKRDIEFKIVKVAALGPIVLNEREDVFAPSG